MTSAHHRAWTVRARVAAVAAVAVAVVGAPPTPADASVTTLTLTGASTATLSLAQSYTGSLTTNGVGVPAQSISVLLDGTSAATATTSTSGGYAVSITFTSYGQHNVQAVAYAGTPLEARSTSLIVTVTPSGTPDTQPTDIADAASFLYQGANAPQQDVSASTISPARVGVIHGVIHTRAGDPLAGVTVTVAGHTEYGSTASRSDGAFDLAVNGGQPLTLNYTKSGYLNVDRIVDPAWRDYTDAPDVVMTALDAATPVTANASTSQMVRGSVQTDSDGSRQATLIVPPSTAASMTLPDGSTQPLSTLHVRATEYTVGANGPDAMPAELPASSGYTYAVDYTVDEAQTAGATAVTFTHPLAAYTDDFLGFPVGTPVPAGWYDETRHRWVPSQDGVVLKVISITSGKADVDVTGDGVADTGTALTDVGITDDERSRLAQTYTTGKSLWRVPISHFTPWDYNYPYGLPGDATAPDQHGYTTPTSGCQQVGSIIGCSARTLGEAVPVAGTPFYLRYDTSRVPGYDAGRSIDIGLTGANPPSSLQSIALEVTVAGRTYRYSFSGAANQRYTFVWNGNDVYGRPVYGSAIAHVQVGYNYQPVYYAPVSSSTSCTSLCGGMSAFVASFGRVGSAPISGGRGLPITVWQSYTAPINGMMMAALQSLGGWTLNIANTYDTTSHTLFMGDGTVRTAARTYSSLATTAGTGAAGPAGAGTYTGDSGPAIAAGLSHVRGLAVAADGTLYLADTDNGVIRKITPGGTISTYAGGGTPASGNGDGGPATSAALITPVALATGPDGSLYIADSGDARIRRVSPNGTISTFAGSGNPTNGIGDGGVATVAALDDPESVAVAPDGTVYVADTGDNRIRRVTTDGVITTVAGGGTPADGVGDGLPGTSAQLVNPSAVAVDPLGQVYIADTDHNRVRKLGTDGLISTFAGNGDYGTGGDGGRATAARVADPTGLSVDAASGGVLIVEKLQNRVRRVDAGGDIALVAGTGAAGWAGDGGPPAAAKFDHPSAASMGPDGRLWIADTDNFRIRRIAPPLPGFDVSDIFVPSTDGSVVYVFNSSGRQKKIVDATTNITLYTFDYDTAGRLAAVTDHFGNVTTIARDANGTPTGIDSPYGQHTTLHANTAGYLDTITDPANENVSLNYGSGGLLASFTDPRNNSSTFTYDTLGHLKTDTSPDGKTTSLSGSANEEWLVVNTHTAEGRYTSYTTHLPPSGDPQVITTFPNGKTSTVTTKPDGTQTITSPTGTTSVATFGPDPRWGMSAPLMTSLTVTRPSGATTTVTSSRSVTLTDAANPLTLSQETDSSTLGGDTTTTTYDATSRTITTTSPAGRSDLTTLNTEGEVATTQDGNLAPSSYRYDTHGRLTTITTGTGTAARTSSIDYGPDGYISDLHDAEGHTTHYTRDAVGRPKTTTLPGGDQVATGYDPNGNVTAVTPPGQPVHHYTYTSGNLTQTYAPPQVDANGNTTNYSYNLDRQPTTTTLPDGRTITDGYDSAGRLHTIDFSRGTAALNYDPTSGLLSSISDPSGDTDSYSYDGDLVTAVTATGPVAATVHYNYGGKHLTSVQVGTGAATSYGYDADGNITAAGSLALSYDPTNGSLSDTTAGVVTTHTGYNNFGEPTSDAAAINGTTAYSANSTRDKLGRLTELTETIDGTTTTTDYTYDAHGRLTDVTRSGTTIEHYIYDGNGNRTEATTPTSDVSANYDSEDRLTSYGSTSYTYNETGQLTSAITGSQTTSYSYDELGELTTVTKPDGTVIRYLYDGAGRRIGKKINGALVQGFIYGTESEPVAETDGNGNVVETFTYSNATVPDLITKNGITYRVIQDGRGSPRLIINASTGQVVEHLEYDTFGSVTSDTNPGFQPFGFTGGIYDPDATLVHLAARDYDPRTGRWLTKDPLQFSAGDANQYAYVGNDPINFVDPTGLHPCADLWSCAPLNVTPATEVVVAIQQAGAAEETGCNSWNPGLTEQDIITLQYRVPDDFVVVRGGVAPPLPPGFVQSGAGGQTLEQAASAVPYGTIWVTTAGDIRAGGGEVVFVPEWNRSQTVLNYLHVDIELGPRGTIWQEPAPRPNPVPKSERIPS
jgi:RHS repeat-associated protein